MLGGITSAVSLRRCFYLSATVFVLSTLMAMAIIIKLSPLESVKCRQPRVLTTPTLEWSSTAPVASVGNNAGPSDIAKSNPDDGDGEGSQRELNEKRYLEMREKNIQNKISRLSWKMKNKNLPMVYHNATSIEINYNVHVFYYAWYRSLEYDRVWKHWDHEYLPNWKKNDRRVFREGRHRPPADIGASYYPSLGCYSSRNPQVIDLHMRQLRDAGVGVLVVSWTPPNTPDNTDPVMPDLLNAAHRYNLKIAPHIEPYPGRNPINLIEHIRYLFSKYSSHPALHRARKSRDGPALPVIYIYDSYVFPSSAWWELLSERGNLTLRGTEIDAIYMGLLVDSAHRSHIKKSRFDGFYTYFAVNGFSYGSTWKNWRELNKFAIQNGLLFVPSLGPGYIDTQVRAWNGENTRHRKHGQYYSVAWKSAIKSGANVVSITSFNEWHEGTQIEPAKPVSNKDFTYLDYEPEGSDFYLNLTKSWVQQFTDRNHRL
ncbi:glycoprotein endo-alpha-1,2-mannosidase-like protein [Diachasma alloeum]|uniref:glycoprotein endo-alpha-1,2-mannosidase-like protein n=1 Tax=Diachasma alloeum TaxID=454923 RepID=UPI0007381E94|nr:glycoprotein endo-alpha-1,2-mannosidase-like protein [Diachasma alloeum]